MSHYLKLSLLVLCGFIGLNASQPEDEERQLLEETNLKLEQALKIESDRNFQLGQELMRQKEINLKFEQAHQGVHDESQFVQGGYASDSSSSIINDIEKRIALEMSMTSIPGARSSDIDDSLAEEVLDSCPAEINKVVARIKKGIFRDIEKDIVLFGVPGTGKSTIAKAIAKECNIPCLIFDAGKISTSYMNSGSMALKQIFSVALEYGKPCIVVFDELESLTKKHTNANSPEGDILISLWQEIDRVNNSNVVVILNMNSKKDLPGQMTGRTTEVHVPLPTYAQRERAFSFHLSEQKERWNLSYEDDIEIMADNLAQITHDFSQRDIKSLIIKATGNAVISGDSKLVVMQDFLAAITIIEKDSKRYEEREKETWLYDAKKYCKDNALPLINTTVGIVGLIAGAVYYIHRHGIDTARFAQTQSNFFAQMKQAQDNFNWQIAHARG
ncbi:MAG: ATP-binding protein [Candidatus Babeliales bacterium]|nr:ATP-binding protein [Candidatus Babeliales bacterium]